MNIAPEADLLNKKSIPLKRATEHDVLREGFVDSNELEANQLKQLQSDYKEKEWRKRIDDVTVHSGMGAAMLLQAEREHLSQFHRLPGIKSSFLGLETALNGNSSFEAEDWLGEQEDAENLLCDIHATMEAKLGM